MKDDDQERIKAYIAAKMAHIKMYNECMNLADGLDVEKFAELVRQDERIAVLETIEELKGMESDRHPMFVRGLRLCLRSH
jgi:ferritin-like protein